MDATLDAVKREGRGKNEANRLRSAGQIPAVVYGSRAEGKTPEGVSISVDPKAVLRILHSDSGANTLINLKLDGNEARVMVKEYQLDPITHHLLHADFYQLAMDKVITVTVPVILHGESRGVKQQGGLIDFVTREIQVQCLPTDIPEHIDVDVTELGLNESIRLRDMPVSPKWKPVTDGDTMLVHVVIPKAEESAQATTEAAAPAAAEPEVIKKGKGRGEREGEEVGSPLKLIVGLGNPGREYRETRHNVGFMIVDEIARRHGLSWSMAPSQVPDAFVTKKYGTDPLLLAKPLTYMNRSGDAVAALARYYDIASADLLIVIDEAALPFGKLRARARGSAGGHNGLKSIVERLGTQEFPRLRLGVGRGDGRRDLADHVLATFEPEERTELESVIARAADAAEMFAVDDIFKVMNVYNPDPTVSEQTD
jgi:aminoacyl-tRNA hydrolase/ribosomal protein bL25 (Ctc-form)